VNALIYLCFLIFILLLESCNITYKVRNQNNDIEYMFYSPCGKAKIELVGKGNSKFTLRQEFNLDHSVNLTSEALQIYYNGKKVQPEFSVKASRYGEIKLDGNVTLEAAFDLEESVFDGDTILVFGQNYLNCYDANIALDTIIFSFVNNLRIQGVND